MEHSPSKPRFQTGRIVQTLLGVSLSAICLVVLARRFDFGQISAAMSGFSWFHLVLALTALSVGYAFRVIRWSVLLNSIGQARVTSLSCAPAYFGSIALNNILPLRAGDIIRALVFPVSMGISRAAATSSILIERIVDLLTLVLGFFACVWMIGGESVSPELQLISISIAAAGLISMGGILLFGESLRALISTALRHPKVADVSLIQRLGGIAIELLDALTHMAQPSKLAMVIGVTSLVWIGETAFFYYVIQGAGGELTVAEAFFVMASATLITLVPSSPGYIGTFHLAVVGALSVAGITGAVSVSIAIITHLALWGGTTLAGVIAMLFNPGLFKSQAKSYE